MKCPVCHHPETRVTHSHNQVRRRECCRCKHRWRTYEVTEEEMQKITRIRETFDKLQDELKAA